MLNAKFFKIFDGNALREREMWILRRTKSLKTGKIKSFDGK